ncbi:MAG: 3'-5' exonuclease [Candidatus Obscuribacterales bacterium]|nr:3'-5' exonuclease [Candidatus Obscuribacterales bacterium]MBX9724963.1 3'-5' exonuclease [Candidatus Obscuribacterales bacterium]
MHKNLPDHPHPKDRAESIKIAQKLLKEGFFILDTETTGIKKKDQVIQIGIIDHTGKVIINSLVKPKGVKKLDPVITDITGITMEMLKDAPTLADIHSHICGALRGKKVLAYNAEFDCRLLNQSCQINGIPEFDFRLYCVMLVYTSFWGERHTSGKYAGQYKWQKLPRTNQDDTHDATTDCRLTLDLLKQMAETPAPEGVFAHKAVLIPGLAIIVFIFVAVSSVCSIFLPKSSVTQQVIPSRVAPPAKPSLPTSPTKHKHHAKHRHHRRPQ